MSNTIDMASRSVDTLAAHGISRMNYEDSIEFMRKWCAENNLACFVHEHEEGQKTTLEIGDESQIVIVVEQDECGLTTIRHEVS